MSPEGSRKREEDESVIMTNIYQYIPDTWEQNLHQGYAKVIVLIPAYNEAKNIHNVISKVKNTLPQIDILVINDGSTDNTAKLAQLAGAKVVSHPFNMGYGVACQTGFKYACRHDYEYAIQMDGDGQHEPDCVPDLLNAIIDPEIDIVLGSRWLGLTSYDGPFIRKFGKHFFAFLASFLTGLKCTDPTTGFQAMGRKVICFYTTEIYPTDYPDADMFILLKRAGFRVKEIPVTMYRNDTGQSMHSGLLRPLYYGFKMLLSISMTLLRNDKIHIAEEPQGHLIPYNSDDHRLDQLVG
jgi:glycosyltransferase involved in cell wall biosynthesis